MAPLHLVLLFTIHGCILALSYSPPSPSWCPFSQQVTTTCVTFTLNGVKVVTSTIQTVHIISSTTTKIIKQTAPENTVVLFGSPTTLEVTKTEFEYYTVQVPQPYVSLVITPVTTTLLEGITSTSTNTLEYVVAKTRTWSRQKPVQQEIYRSTLPKVTQKVAQKAPTCSMVVMKAHNTTDITSTVDIVVTSTTTTTSYILETFTTTFEP